LVIGNQAQFPYDPLPSHQFGRATQGGVWGGVGADADVIRAVRVNASQWTVAPKASARNLTGICVLPLLSTTEYRSNIILVL